LHRVPGGVHRLLHVLLRGLLRGLHALNSLLIRLLRSLGGLLCGHTRVFLRVGGSASEGKSEQHGFHNQSPDWNGITGKNPRHGAKVAKSACKVL